MSAFPIAEAPIFTRLHRYVREHNDVQSSCKYKIRNGVKNTLLVIINEYIKEFRKVEKAGFEADSDALPSLRTNRHALAALTGSGKRTIFDHIMLLIEAGFVAKQCHGWQKNFELWICPWIVLGDSYRRPELIDLKTAKTSRFKPDIRQSSPPKSILETLPNCLISGVDLSKSSTTTEKRDSPTNPRLIKHTIELLTLETAGERTTVNVPQTKETAPGGARPARPHIPVQADDNGGQRAGNGPGVTTQAPTGSVPTKPINSALFQYQRTLVLSFWQLAQEKLWPSDHFSDDHRKRICNLIWNEIFLGFKTATSQGDSVAFYQSKVQQLEKAERYIRKQNWTSVIPPLKYFSLAFHEEQKAKGEKGNFHYTTAWQLADEAARKKLDQDKILTAAVRSVLDEKAPKGLKGGALMSRIALYQYWSDRLKKTVDLDLVVRFNEQVSSLVKVHSPLDINQSTTPIVYPNATQQD